MTYHFDRFVLDESRRELRLGARALEMQPRTFDVLVYLLRHADRVVTKDELFSAVWPDVIVTESSIMRAISVIRALLREGGLPDAIQTFSRQGYRFVGELGGPTPEAGDPRIERARSAGERGDWHQAFALFQELGADHLRRADDFERWANAALYIGHPHDAVAPLERAIALRLQDADRVGAARAALMLTNVHLEGRTLSIAKGWHSRAAAYLADEPGETREHGLHLWLSARIGLFEADLPRALAEAKRAEALAQRIDDPEVEALGLVYRAHVELATGEVRAGLAHMDEAGAATLTGTVGPWVSGFLFCSVIWAYLDRGDLNRAGQWTDQFTRWVKQNNGFGAPGLCRLHRGEVLCVQGDLQAAESEIQRARELLAVSARYAEGDACRVLGDIRLLRGDLSGAEEAFRQAHALGWNPLPGWALVQAEKGQASEAVRTLQRALRFPDWANGQRKGLLLAHLTRIAARQGNLRLARRALSDLRRSKNLRTASCCEACFRLAGAEVALAGGHPEEAIQLLRGALAVWLEAGSRINAAHTRMRLAEVLAATGGHREAELEFSSAEDAFGRMSAERLAERCRAARLALSSPA